MSTSRLIRRRMTLRKWRSGPLGAYIELVAAQYIEQRYSRCYRAASLLSIGRFGRWLKRSHLKPRDIDEQLIDRYLHRSSARLHCSAPPALRNLLRVMRAAGACPPPVLIARGPDQVLEDDFREYLVTECGLAARTVEHYTEAAHAFLTASPSEEDRVWSALTAGDVLTFVRRHAETRIAAHVQPLCTGLRAFLRYLRFRGEIQSDLAASVPRIAHWRLAMIPKSLSSAQVQQVLAHCNRQTAVGRRNYAVLMLLARLGLRADEIRCLTLDDIDWGSGQLTIHSKGSGRQAMPLPSDVGEALAAYLADGRPPSTSRVVFVRLVPPHIPLADGGTMATLTARAMRAAGVDAPSKGAHVFRHSLATQMLRNGASLREIGHVLRHRDEDTTRIYAKVDLTRLRTLALSWPGGAS